LGEDAGFEYNMIDGSIVKVHRHGQGSNVWPAPVASGDWVTA
jgi:hypothetical protein